MRVVISNSSDKPIYEQIASQIKDSIISGELIENQLLPSIRNLAKELKVSVITTKRAYEELEKEGYIVTLQGKGSFVAAQNRQLLRETRMRIVEEKLVEVVSTAKTIKISLVELQEMLKILYEEV